MDNQPNAAFDLSDIALEDPVTHNDTVEGTTAVAVAVTAEPVPDLPVHQSAPLIDLARMPEAFLRQAEGRSQALDITRPETIQKAIDVALKPLTEASRALIGKTSVRDAGEMGGIVTEIMTSVKILKLNDIRKEMLEQTGPAKGLFRRAGKMLSLGKSAIQSYGANRQKFINVLAAQEAKVRRMKADGVVALQLQSEEDRALRSAVSELRLTIAAFQMLHDRASAHYEALRVQAVESCDPAEAAFALQYRSRLLILESTIVDTKEALQGAANLVPVLSMNTKSMEIRVAKLNSVLTMLPEVTAASSQAIMAANMMDMHSEGEKIAEARRIVGLKALEATHDVAVNAARCLGGDSRNLDYLQRMAERTVQTLKEVQGLEDEARTRNTEREQGLQQIQHSLMEGMLSIQKESLSS
ncbi:hypothetical protein ACTVH1_18810 [Gluconobacter cerinus]